MSAAAVQTLTQEQEPDLFMAPTRMAFEGELLSDARVTAKPCDHGSAYPVLMVELLCDGPAHRVVHAEKTYPSGMRFLADADALHLRKGMRVSVRSSLVDAHLHLPHTDSIKPISATQTH